jgi:hypothetical protein
MSVKDHGVAVKPYGIDDEFTAWHSFSAQG